MKNMREIDVIAISEDSRLRVTFCMLSNKLVNTSGLGAFYGNEAQIQISELVIGENFAL